MKVTAGPTLSTYSARIIRYGYNFQPKWTIGEEVTAPPAGTALVTVPTAAGEAHKVWGLLISATEGNSYKLNWTHAVVARSMRFVAPTAGTILIISETALNEGLPADQGWYVTITNVTAGGAGQIYQAALLYG